jgi:hypothetical protein
MNNLKERNSVLNGLQESSEDPPGFIYPTYRAASTETQRDKPPLKSPHQGVAYVSSSVGGSVSTLSFEETITKNRLSPSRRCGGGIRDRVRGFSRASRTNLLRRLASINRSAFRTFKGRIVFVTLTYPGYTRRIPNSARDTSKPSASASRGSTAHSPPSGGWVYRGGAHGISTCSCS